MSLTLLEQVTDAITEIKLDASVNHTDDIAQFITHSDCPYIEYTPWMMDFHCQYLNFEQNRAERFYLLLKLNGKAVGLLPLVVSELGGNIRLGSNAGGLLAPYLLEGLSRKQQRKLMQKCLDFYTQLGKQLEIPRLTSEFIFTPGRSEAWYSLLQAQGATPKFSQELFCDLSLSTEDYWQSIRDKYRSHIKKAQKLWRIEVKNVVSSQEYSEFQQLHLDVVGFKTRTDLTWKMLRDAVNRQQAFCVFGYDQNNKMIGGAQFSHTNHRACYSVGVYDRSLFAQPVSHIVHYKAIEQMKALGLTTYHLGARCNHHEWMAPSEKEQQIGHFKEGFATHSLFKLTMDWYIE